MKRRTIIGVAVLAGLCGIVLLAQDIKAVITGTGGAKPALAVVDFRGAGDAQPLMGALNPVVFSDLQNSALFDMKPKGMFPLNYPQQPSDLRPEDAGQGYALKDWAGTPVNASHLVFGYTAVQNGVLVLYGYVYDVRQPMASAQLMFDRVADTPNADGATRIAHKFASDIIAKFGGASLLGTRIYFTSDQGATGQFGTELWVMDWDGSNKKKLTNLRGQLKYPSVSMDGAKIAFTIFPSGPDPRPRIGMVDSESGRPVSFYNQAASLNAAASFTPDGQRVYYSSSASGTAQIYTANTDGSGFSRITSTRGNPSEPKVNPKNPDSLLFVDGPPEQIFRMNGEGGGIERVTNGEGEASNPAWSPDGQHIAFAWTRGYQAGKFNIFVMDIGAPGSFVQLTHGEGNERNENPVWAPDGAHLVFSSTRAGGKSQIFSMLADGTQVKQLTTQGTNKYPVWGVK
jgi:TolB protein